MIIYKQTIENGNPIYEIITKSFKSISVKFDESFSKNELYKLLSLLEGDVDNMKSLNYQ
ncbi:MULTISPECIES: C1q-binding complement inhibitor VraX [Staphylococcus]|uniref:Protein VraX n=1 Tax=Staphylococcus hsinchuensis TaxID=3051183 RepID=A0ABZ3EFW3_9STAP|nr:MULTISPECIES: C1q-binding complement inhibitor VraX [unclassified Staphylococcus]